MAAYLASYDMICYVLTEPIDVSFSIKQGDPVSKILSSFDDDKEIRFSMLLLSLRKI